MTYLLIVSLIWAFSFGLIKNQLAGLDANFIAAARLLASLIVFLPFLRIKNVPRKEALYLFLVGAIQFGVMYIAYNYAFQYLKAYEVALFTIFTPLFVTLTNDAFKRRLHGLSLLAAILAIIGTAIVRRGGLLQSELVTGFLIVQISNIAFAFGQVFYKEIMARFPESQVSNLQVFGLVFLGGFLTAASSSLVFTDWQMFQISTQQILVLVFLGSISSGLCFFLWNVGARKVNTGTLAIFNDLKIPLAVAVSLIFFGEKANLWNLILGGALVVGALWLNEWGVRRANKGKTATIEAANA